MFLQKLSAEAHTEAPAETSEYTDIAHQVYAGNYSEKHYITIVHGNLRHTFGKTIIKGSPHSTASIDFVVEKRQTYGTIAPVG